MRARWLCVAALPLVLVLLSCGGRDPAALSRSQARQLPRDVSDLIDLCTKLPSVWKDPSYQRIRMLRLKQADALAQVLMATPDAIVTGTATDDDSGELFSFEETVRRLAKEQLELFDNINYCRRSRATPPDAAREALIRIAHIRKALRSS